MSSALHVFLMSRHPSDRIYDSYLQLRTTYDFLHTLSSSTMYLVLCVQWTRRITQHKMNAIIEKLLEACTYAPARASLPRTGNFGRQCDEAAPSRQLFAALNLSSFLCVCLCLYSRTRTRDRPTVWVCPCMLQHVSRSAYPSLSFFSMLHAAAGRAFTRTSAREYRSTAYTKDTVVVSRHRERPRAESSGLKTSMHTIMGSS